MSIIKKKIVSEKLEDFSFGLLGESGIGKTTTMVEICEKEFGEDGYAILNMGKEQGVDCIEGAAYVDIPTAKHFDAVIKEFIKNKDTEYPNLKVVVFDTLDQLIEIMEPKIIDMWNKENLGKKDFIQAKTMNAAWTGFGHAEDKLIQVILDKVWELKKVGIQVWYTMHTKSREQVDPYSGQSYNILSTNMMQKYFNGFKTKIHVVGIACVDRTIEVEKTGRKNIMTKKDITVNKVKSERRKVIFRDDNYGVDSKSRFAEIVDEVPLDSDEIITALKDCIVKSKNKRLNGLSQKSSDLVTKKSKPDPVEEPEEIEDVEDLLKDENIVDEELDDVEDIVEEDTSDKYPDNLLEEVMSLYKESKDAKLKKEIREIVKSFGKFNDCDEDTLKEIFDKLK